MNSNNYVDGLELRIKELESQREQVAVATNRREENMSRRIAELEESERAMSVHTVTLVKRIEELEAVIKSHGIPVKTYAGGEAHYCFGDLLTETHLMSDAYNRIRAERTLAADDPEYDLFAWGWRAAVDAMN
jgi:hypothetical protein